MLTLLTVSTLELNVTGNHRMCDCDMTSMFLRITYSSCTNLDIGDNVPVVIAISSAVLCMFPKKFRHLNTFILLCTLKVLLGYMGFNS